MDSFLRNILEFAGVLRRSGIKVSVPEVLDVVRVLTVIDPLDRQTVKTACKACLAKTVRDRQVFDAAFERFFVPPEIRERYKQEKTAEIRERRKEIQDAASELAFQGETLQIPEELKGVYAGLPETERQGIQQFLERTSSGKNVRPEFKSVVENMVQGRLSGLGGQYLQAAGSRPELDADAISEAGMLAGDISAAVREQNSLLYKNLGDIGEDEIPKVLRLISLLTADIRRSARKKYRRTKRRAALDMRKTIGGSLGTGGVPLLLKHRKRSPKRDRILLLCDVSASMYRFSGFAARFVAGIHASLSAADSYIFSEEAERLAIDRLTHLSGFEDAIKNSGVWRKGTNIGKVLQYILYAAPVRPGSSTVVLVISDGRTVEAGLAVKYLKRLQGAVKRILWLNPVPEAQWEKSSSIVELGKYCTMLDCSTLERLSAACLAM